MAQTITRKLQTGFEVGLPSRRSSRTVEDTLGLWTFAFPLPLGGKGALWLGRNSHDDDGDDNDDGGDGGGGGDDDDASLVILEGNCRLHRKAFQLTQHKTGVC
eukprot:925641-Pelagomonas_calceolata.AAC.3